MDSRSKEFDRRTSAESHAPGSVGLRPPDVDLPKEQRPARSKASEPFWRAGMALFHWGSILAGSIGPVTIAAAVLIAAAAIFFTGAPGSLRSAPPLLFFVSAAFVLYIVAGYPLILNLIPPRYSKPVRRAPMFPDVSLIVTVYNGERFLESKLESILALTYPPEKLEIIVASDGSIDRTNEIAESFAGRGVRLLPLPRAGKAAAINAAIAEARHDMLVFTDVRQLLAPDSLAYLMENFADPSVGVASGELVILESRTQEEASVGLYWRYELSIRLRLSEIDSIFGATGAYYAIRRELVPQLPSSTLLDDMHLPLAAFFQGYRLIVDPRARMFDYPTNLQDEFRRKVRTLAGNYQIVKAYPGLLGTRNRLWPHFWSYKFGRLLLPFALITCFATSFSLPAPWWTLAVFGQVAFYALAMIDLFLGEMFPLKRLTSPIRTFVTLMAATVCAVSILFAPSQTLWKPTRATGGSPT
jgi:cellulose synthase/poly-beta-1,6-N-acetylglucosamine synthase-like glycosyltransferase